MRVVAVGEAVDELVELRLAPGLLHPFQIDGLDGNSERDVPRDARVGKEDRLRHVRDAALPAAAVVLRKRNAVDRDPPGTGLEQPHQQIGEGALAASGLADQRDAAPAGISKLTSWSAGARRLA